MIRPALLACMFVFFASSLQAQSLPDASALPSTADIESMEACLAETVMVAEPDHCVGLLSDACIATGGTVLDCLDREEAVWAAILKEHWPFRCGTCPGGFSLSHGIRARHVSNNADCITSDLAAKRCLMIETARQASHVFLNEQH